MILTDGKRYAPLIPTRDHSACLMETRVQTLVAWGLLDR